MKPTPTLSQLVRAIAQASDDATASSLFQELYSRIANHFYNSFYALCWRAFKLTKASILAEEVYYDVLEEMEADIRSSKFTVREDETDEVVSKRFLARALMKAYWRILNAYNRNKRQATIRSTDLTANQNRTLDAIPTSQEFDSEMAEAHAYVNACLSKKDADMIQTYYCSELSQAEAQELLMLRYNIPSEAAFKKAIARAKAAFKTHLRQFKTERSTAK